jgi:hypothetical protein
VGGRGGACAGPGCRPARPSWGQGACGGARVGEGDRELGARSCLELHPGRMAPGPPAPLRAPGRPEGVGSAGRSAALGLAWGWGLGNPRSSGLRSWKFPFAPLHSGPHRGISRTCCWTRNWGVSTAFEEREPGARRDEPLCPVCQGHLKDRAVFAPALMGAGTRAGAWGSDVSVCESVGVGRGKSPV